jgi:hypothetical protein
MRKYLTKGFLASKGWRNIRVGGHLVSYCETCKVQRHHNCTGENDMSVLRFECSSCKERLDAHSMG